MMLMMMGLNVHSNLLQLILDRGWVGDGYLCPTNYPVSLTTKTINIKVANMDVVNVSTIVGKKVTKTVFEKKTTVENNSRCSERAPLTYLDTVK